MLRYFLAFIAVASSTLPALAQGRYEPLPQEPRISLLTQLDRESQALEESPDLIARLLIRFDGGDVTTSLLKPNPYGFRLNAASGGMKWKGVARNEKPKRLEAGVGEAVVSSDWTMSSTSRRARCVKDHLGDGFYQVMFLRRTDTSDKERDGYICAFAPLALPKEDIMAWIESIEPQKVLAFNSCAEASNDQADQEFWSCLTDSGIKMPELTLEMAKRIKG